MSRGRVRADLLAGATHTTRHFRKLGRDGKSERKEACRRASGSHYSEPKGDCSKYSTALLLLDGLDPHGRQKMCRRLDVGPLGTQIVPTSECAQISNGIAVKFTSVGKECPEWCQEILPEACCRVFRSDVFDLRALSGMVRYRDASRHNSQGSTFHQV